MTRLFWSAFFAASQGGVGLRRMNDEWVVTNRSYRDQLVCDDDGMPLNGSSMRALQSETGGVSSSSSSNSNSSSSSSDEDDIDPEVAEEVAAARWTSSLGRLSATRWDSLKFHLQGPQCSRCCELHPARCELHPSGATRAWWDESWTSTTHTAQRHGDHAQAANPLPEICWQAEWDGLQRDEVALTSPGMTGPCTVQTIAAASLALAPQVECLIREGWSAALAEAYTLLTCCHQVSSGHLWAPRNLSLSPLGDQASAA